MFALVAEVSALRHARAASTPSHRRLDGGDEPGRDVGQRA
jgi:hypothetical protein